MPVYSMQDTDTSEVFEVSMKYSELTEYLANHSHLKQVFTKFPGVVDSARIGVRKIDSSFRDVLSKAKSAHLHSTIDTK
jgi:antibiotic biosynthesis monooxygenase (ABM) superfamily enzyme